MSDQRLYLTCRDCSEFVLIAKQASPAWEFVESNEEEFNRFMFAHCKCKDVRFEIESEVDYWPEHSIFERKT